MTTRHVVVPSDKLALDKPRTFCGTIEEARYAARERRERKPQPWVVRKLMVVVTLGIMGYAGYVYAGRFSVRLMHGGRRPAGIGLLTGWTILYMWMIWAYIKVVFTPPGTARDYVPQTPQPLFQRTPQWNDQPYDDDYDFNNTALADIASGRIGGPAYVPEDVPSTPPAAHIPGTSLPLPNANGHATPPAPPRRKSSTGQENRSARGWPPTAPLLPPHRYCQRCSIVKPFRAHHCRVCGTCILKYDHHCPWIGQCVGARNHKFFLNFAFATVVFTSYTFASLLAFNAHQPAVGESDVDPQEIVLIALAALFWVFTASLGVAHTRMILLSQTTVESMGVQRTKEREAANLERKGVRCWDVRAKRRALKSLDVEWGKPDTEGNLWWAGSPRKGWEDVMGQSVWGWIFPIGAPLGDGTHYVPNPRFDAEGRWRRRAEWPEELR